MLQEYDKNLKGLQNIMIYHELLSMDAYPQLPNLEARILSVHQINKALTTLIIVTLVIDSVPEAFFDHVNERSDIMNREKLLKVPSLVLFANKSYICAQTNYVCA